MISIPVLVALLATAAPSIPQKFSMNADAGAKREDTTHSGNPGAAAAGSYIIGANDLLTVNVWKEPDLSRSVLVRPDGKITLPLLKDVEAGGSTPEQLEASIEKALSQYISTPAVTVIVQEARSHTFNILGQVLRPGNYPLNTKTTLLDAIAMAGGFREWAKVGHIYILRENSSGNRERIPFNYKKVIKGDDKDIQLGVKDTIVVP
jgi:polysaccharide export outer membrane protein